MTSRERRLRKLELLLTDPSGLVPHTRKWLEYWDRQIYDFMTDPEERWPAILFPLDAYCAVMKHMSDPGSLVGSIPNIDE